MRVLIIARAANAKAFEAALVIQTYLSSQEVECLIVKSDSFPLGIEEEERSFVPDILLNEDGSTQAFDMIISLGGDGTMLRSARFADQSGTPILGINFGNLGFLANESADGAIPLVMAALAGEMRIEQRTNLSVEVCLEGDQGGKGNGESDAQDVTTFFALNEIVFSRGILGRIIDFKLRISGENVARMRGDGIIVSTATGSTAYALSSGGPLVSSGYRGMIVVPLAVHSLQVRPILTEPNDVVEIEPVQGIANDDALLYVDGELHKFDRPIHSVRITRGEVPTRMLRSEGSSFYRRISSIFF